MDLKFLVCYICLLCVSTLQGFEFPVFGGLDKTSSIELAANPNTTSGSNKNTEETIQQAPVEFAFEKTNMGNSYGKSTHLFDIVSHITDTGFTVLQELFDEIKTQTKQSQNETVLDNILEDYFNDMTQFYEYLSKQMVKCELDREFYILEFIATTQKLLETHCLILLNTSISEIIRNEIIDSEELIITNITRYVKEMVQHAKKTTFDFVCEKVNICRRVPSYSDYVAEILIEMASLSDHKIDSITKIFNEIVMFKSGFFKLILDHDLANEMVSNMASLQDISEARKLLLYIAKILSQRHHIFRSQTGSIKMRKKALRILIDLFDKCFETLTEESIREDANDVVLGLRTWKSNDSYDIQKVIMEFFVYIENIIQPFLRRVEIRNEVKTLLGFIVRGRSRYFVMVNEELFSKGSKFVNSDNPDMQYHNSGLLQLHQLELHKYK